MVKELARHDGADRVTSCILPSRVATTVPVEPGERVEAARLQFASENIAIGHSGKYFARRAHGDGIPSSSWGARRNRSGSLRSGE